MLERSTSNDWWTESAVWLRCGKRLSPSTTTTPPTASSPRLLTPFRPLTSRCTPLQSSRPCSQVKSEAPEYVVVAALLHDIGWKLSGCEPTKIDFNQEESCTADDCAPVHASMAEQLGILALCGGEASAEKQRAQHDVIGATFLRCPLWRGVSYLVLE